MKSDENPVSGNLGLQDQRLALEWVQNIHWGQIPVSCGEIPLVID
ncbi:MAG: carboxylesterase family protein [Proteobacteria bacterium]|nr:carboxylesterase family protein [Pseudomonadota bacterium]